MNLHYLRHNKTLLKYLMVCVLLFSVFLQWHSTVHAVQSNTECQLCITSFDFDDLICSNACVFEAENNPYGALLALHYPQFSATIAFSGNRDPPNTL